MSKDGTMLVYDPRPPETTRARLAPRLETLVGKRVLLFDNGKLDPQFRWAFPVVFEVLEGTFTRQFGVSSILHRTEYLLPATPERLSQLAEEIDTLAVDAVVFALLDAGIAQPTVVLAIELEKRGIPTASICYGPGAQLAAASSASLIEALSLHTVNVMRTAGQDEMRQEANRLVTEVAAGLTAGEETIKQWIDAGRAALPVPCVSGGILELEAQDATARFTRLMLDSGVGDGFPLFCPTIDGVERLLSEAGIDPQFEVWPVVPPRREPLTAQEVGVIAAMCGVRPEWMPFVLAAFEAMAEEEFHLPLAAISGNPAGTLVLISGWEALRRGIACRDGCLGPGHAANASIGRTVALSYSVALGARIGSSDTTLQGSPSQYSYCCAENLVDAPWPGLHADLAGGDESVIVTVLRCDGPRTVIDNLSTTPEALLRTFAAAMTSIASNNAYVPRAQIVVFMNPEHASIVHAGGWSKRDAQQFLFETARNESSEVEGRGYIPNRAPWMSALSRIPAVEHAEDILIAVVGAPGNLSQVSLPWGFARGASRTVSFPQSSDR